MFVTTIHWFAGKNISSEEADVIPDPRAGRVDVGATFEDFHLFWPIRPKTWFKYPEGSPEQFKKLSRDELLLREEQNAYTEVDNAVFMGQQHSTSSYQVYANDLFVSFQKKLSQIYKPDVDLRKIEVKERLQFSNYDSEYEQFWDDHVVDNEIQAKLNKNYQAALYGGIAFGSVLLYSWARTARSRPIALPAAIFGGFASFGAITLAGRSLFELEGLHQDRWYVRVNDAIHDFAKENGITTKKYPFSAQTEFPQPFSDPFTRPAATKE